WPLGPAFVTPIAVFLLHPFGDLSKTEKTSLHHSFTAVSGGGNCRKEVQFLESITKSSNGSLRKLETVIIINNGEIHSVTNFQGSKNGN
ncbi:MAG: hypothetical protein ACK5NV_04960, partial [Burkholderiales bacterium]